MRHILTPLSACLSGPSIPVRTGVSGLAHAMDISRSLTDTATLSNGCASKNCRWIDSPAEERHKASDTHVDFIRQTASGEKVKRRH